MPIYSGVAQDGATPLAGLQPREDLMPEPGARADARRDRATVLALFLAALVIRVVYTLLIDVGRAIPPGSDSVSYDNFARAILAGTGWIFHPGPELYRPPGYPFILALLYAITGKSLAVVQCLQSLAGAASVVLVYEFGRRHVGRTAALLAAVWLLVNPLHLDFNGRLLRETWLVLLNVALLASLLAGDGLRARGVWRTALLFTLLAHVDSRYLFHLPFFAAYYALAAGGGTRAERSRPATTPNAAAGGARGAAAAPVTGWAHRRVVNIPGAVRPTLLFAAAVVLFSAPWAIRNALAYDHLVIIDPRVLGLWGGRARTAVVGESRPAQETYAGWETLKQARLDSLSAEERAAFQAGLRPKSGQPARAIYNVTELWRIMRLRPEYRPLPDGRYMGVWSRSHNAASLLFMGLLLPAFLLGAWRALARADRFGLVLLAFIAVHTLLHVVVHSTTRYRLPVEPFYGLIAFQEVARWMGRRRAPSSVPEGPEALAAAPR